MSKEYFINLKKTKNHNKEVIKKKKELITFKNLIKAFYNTDLGSNISLLDLGCSDMSLVTAATEKGYTAQGVDVDTVNFENEQLKFSNNSFDIVICTSVIEHLYSFDNIFREVNRVLKKGGFFIIVTPNWKYNVKNFFDDPTHKHPFTERSLNFALSSFDFQEINILPWLVNKPSWMWKVPFKFFLARIIPFRGDTKLWLPNFLKGRSKSLLAVSKKIN